jgi:hypothetical protein
MSKEALHPLRGAGSKPRAGHPALEDIEAVKPSTYNPRSADPERLDLIELSLRKLGFLAPIFADANGEILSGHQRHLVATRMGAKALPVFRTRPMDLAQRKALNIVFNRATNDFDWNSTPQKVTRELAALDVHRLAEAIPDKAVEEGREWTSIFLASVLNSVPFLSDREHITVILQALCRPETKVYACASSVSETGWKQVNGKAFLNKSNSANIAFRLDYETGIRIGDFQDKPKVQKYHTQNEFHQLWTPFFRSVKVREMSNNITAICAHALPVDRDRLRAALEFEFDLPYPDGTRMGLVQEAIAAFETRLKIHLRPSSGKSAIGTPQSAMQ